MPLVLTIQWVDQAAGAEPGRRIAHVGGVSGNLRWRHTLAQAVQYHEQNLFDYYVKVPNAALKLEVTLTPGGGKLLQPKTSQAPADLLLQLPPFPPLVDAQPPGRGKTPAGPTRLAT